MSIRPYGCRVTKSQEWPRLASSRRESRPGRWSELGGRKSSCDSLDGRSEDTDQHCKGKVHRPSAQQLSGPAVVGPGALLPQADAQAKDRPSNRAARKEAPAECLLTK